MSENTVSRRDLIRYATAGGVLAGTGAMSAWALKSPETVRAATVPRLAASKLPAPYSMAFQPLPTINPYKVTTDGDGVKTAFYQTTMREGSARIVPGLVTPVYGYDGKAPGPTVKVNQGTKVIYTVKNQLPLNNPIGLDMEPDEDGVVHEHGFQTSVHLHGSASLPQYDGYASDVTNPGYYKNYHYPNFQRARTLWYHDHGVMKTAQNAYVGLAAQYHVKDPIEKALLPQGAYDVGLIIRDLALNADGTMFYDDQGRSGMWGDIITVNGVPWPNMKVKRRVYRFRILNASIVRSLNLKLSTNEPVHFVATDGGLMPKTEVAGSWRHGVAERYEILIDFRKYKAGTKIQLLNVSPKNNQNFQHTNKVMQFQVEDGTFSTLNNRIPTLLDTDPTMKLKESDAVKTRRLEVKRQGGEWTINGDTWADVIKSRFQKVLADPALGDTEIWELTNPHGGWHHPLHIHLIDFKILDRQVENGPRRPAAVYERGPKDVTFLGENETVRVIMKFGPHEGRYMVHCHNLVHEDHDMMHQFRVGPLRNIDPNDPINAAPPQVIEE